MSTLLFKNILTLEGRRDVLVKGNRFDKVASADTLPLTADRVIDGAEKALLPPFYNGHTHAAMNLLRGYADDMPLFTWLQEHIWPIEAVMTADDMYHGVRLSMLEMIKSGTVFFNDMYFCWHHCLPAVEEMGMRASVADTLIDRGDADHNERFFAAVRQNAREVSGLIQYAVAPHAVYTVGEDLFRRCADTARELNLRLHIHLSETESEVADCRKAHHGMSPVQWLDHLGVLGPDTIAAHTVHIDETDMDILKARGVVLVHNPASNMKLASGIFPSDAVIRKGLKVCLGTDGASSNNNVDMHEEMKLAALLAKVRYSAESLPAATALEWATCNGAEAFGIDAGRIAEGKLADALVVNTKDEKLQPCHHLLSNWVYSADNRGLESVMCNGRFLMENGKVAHEDEILENACRTAFNLVKKAGK